MMGKLVRHSVVAVVGLLLFCHSAGMTFASEYDGFVKPLEKDNWHEYFSSEIQRARLNSSFDALLALTRNKGIDWKIRNRGLILLSETTDPRRAGILIGMFHNPFYNAECPAIKSTLVTALGNIQSNPDVVETLIEGMSDTEIQVREAAVRALGRIGSAKAVPFLIERLDDRSIAIRLDAIRSLGAIGDERALPFLKKLVYGDQDGLIRHEALTALTRMKS